MINWGIIGAGNIANRFADSLEYFDNAQLYAIACRTMDKSIAFQKKHTCQKIFDDYQKLLDDPTVDLIYIAVPHLFHYEWIIKALTCGKGVLCEKPATMDKSEMVAVAFTARSNKTLFMEAMKSRFVPAYRAAKELVFSGEIGEVTKIYTSFCRNFPEKEASYHYSPQQGGALLDMGIYNLSLIEDFSTADLKVGSIDYKLHKNQIDIYLKASLVNNQQFEAIVETGFDRTTNTIAVLEGTKGTLTIPNFHRATTFNLATDKEIKQFNFPYDHDDFYSEIDAMHCSYQKGELENRIMTLDDSIKCAALLEAIKKRII